MLDPLPIWLILATDGPALGLGRVAADRAQTVATGAELLDGLEAARPRVVVLGVPPTTDAELELVADARRHRPGLRAMLVAPAEAAPLRLRALDLGFDAALPDCLTADELEERAVRLGRRPDRAGRRTIRIGDGVEIDLEARELRRDGLAVGLRPKEYGLLTLLATHPGRAFSRRELLRRVWGPEPTSDPRTVDVHVRWIRAKLATDPTEPSVIATVRGTGYRYDPPLR